MSHLLSVVIPVYNVEDYLPICLDSVMNQTYQDLEIIIVDDGSKDNSGKICDEYKMKDERIQVIHQKNGGLSDARNTGLEHATGEYIVFLDSDDSIHPKMYEIMMDKMLANNCEIVVCDYQEVIEGKEPVLPANLDVQEIKMTREELDNGYLMFEKKTRFVVAWNKIYKKSLFDEIRYPFGKIHEDAFTTYKLLYKAKGVVYLDIPFYYYLIRKSSIMGQGFSRKRFLILEALTEELAFFEQNQEYKAMGLVFLDYRDYLIDYFHKIKSDSEISVSELNSYFGILNQYLWKMKQMQIPFKKRLKSIIFCKFKIVIG